jgi:hypothetical protein
MCFLSRSRVLKYRRRKRSPAYQQEGGLHNLGTISASAESFAPPATSIPHRDRNLPDHVPEDAKASRDIFSSPSSVRGYEDARGSPRHGLTPGLFNSDTGLAGRTLSRSANSRLEAFGQAVKQRLSESRLSKESLKTIARSSSSQDSPERRGMVSTSYASTGLTDLLMSRAASDGGYDSDAKTISTLRVRKSTNPGSSKTRSEYSTEALRSQHNASPEKTSSTVSIPEQKPDLVEVTTEGQDIHGEDAFHDTASVRADVQEDAVTESNKSNGGGIVQKDESRRMVPSACLSLSDNQSIYLADTHISQRLASTSMMPMTSLSSTDFSSSTEYNIAADLSRDVSQMAGPHLQQHSVDSDLPWRLRGQASTAGRYLSFVAQEHNRKPSDPRTRKLFEDTTDGSRLHPKWNSITYKSSMLNNPKEGDLTREGGNSHHMGKGELLGSGTISLMDIVRSGAIKNPNSLAVPGRSAAADMGQRQESIGRLSNAEEGSRFGDSKHKGHHSLQGSKQSLAPHKKGSEAASVTCIRRSTSRESRFTEEAMYCQSKGARTFPSSAEVNEVMSEVSEGAVQEKRHERMSEMVPDLYVSKARSRRSSDETRSTSGGWLTQGRRSGFGYNFIERTTSHDSRLSRDHQDVEGLTGETAAIVWDREFKSVRGRPTESSSKSILSLSFRSSLVGRKPSRSSFNGHLRRPRSVSSERGVTPKDLTSEHLDPLENHQQMVAEARKPLPRLSAQWSFGTGDDESSRAASVRDSLREKGLFDVQRYTIAGVKENRAASAVAVRDFPSGEKDGVQTRDFSPPSPDLKTSRLQSNFSSHNHRSASSREVNGPGSWRKRASGRTKRKSRSMTFSPKQNVAHRSFSLQLRDFYRSQSSNLGRYQTGHRSSITLSRESKHPELDIPAGFGSPMPFAISPTPSSRRSLDEFRISEGTSDNRLNSGKHGKEEIWRASSPIPIAHETENCFPAGEAQRWSPPNSMQKGSVSNGFDGPASSRISGEYPRSMKKSNSDLSSAQQRRGDGSYDSFLNITMNNGFGNATGDFGVETNEFGLASRELRDSTIDFRAALMEREGGGVGMTC